MTAIVRCRCDEAIRNSRRRKPDPVVTFDENDDGEEVCVWCWEPVQTDGSEAAQR